MSKVIVFTNQTGAVTVCSPTGELPIEEVRKKDIPEGVASFIVEASALPLQDEDFFDAWEQSNGLVTVNITKAKNITKNRLRFERKSLLVEQDIAFQKALEIGADTTKIVAEKNRLRDITKLADNAESLAELRKIKANIEAT